MKSLFESAIAKEKKCADEVDSIKNLKQEKKLEMYRHLRSKKVKIGKRLDMFENLPDHINLGISLDKEGKLHFPVFILYD